ncbi:MAG: hypothetical protein KA369_08515 [Spirochaetes bacterium]|nr:hypothetical protein [Spirochaetota bacterium]
MKRGTMPNKHIHFYTEKSKVAEEYTRLITKIKKKFHIPIMRTIPDFLVDKLKEEEKNNFENLKKYI